MEGQVIVMHHTTNSTLAHYRISGGGIIPQIGDKLVLEESLYKVEGRTFLLQSQTVKLFVRPL